MSCGRVMTDRTEKAPGFRNAMYALIGVLFIAYIGMKAWHISLALEVWKTQPIAGPTDGAAK